MARTARQLRSVASARSASHRAVWGPSPRKILDLLRSFLVQSWDETARFNNLLARLSILLVRRPPHLPHLLLRPCVSRPAMSGGEGGGERGEGNVAGLETNCGQYQMWFQEFATSDRQTAAFCSCSPSRDIAVQLVHSMNFQWRSGVGICWHKVLSMAGPPPPPPPPPTTPNAGTTDLRLESAANAHSATLLPYTVDDRKFLPKADSYSSRPIHIKT